jgi:uncharacterized protein YfaT (DUF1175 family)
VAILIVLAAAACAGALFHGNPPRPLRLSLDRNELVADGYDTAILTVESGAKAKVSVESRTATVIEIAGESGKREYRIRAGILPGPIRVRVEGADGQAAIAQLTSTLFSRDSIGDGTPDFLRLDNEHDRQAFRRWFAFLAEVQYFRPEPARPAEIGDCAALLRYAYREALRRHDGAWADAAALPIAPAFDSVSRYQYPYTPLGAALYRVKSGEFRAADLSDGTFLQFADAQTLWRRNTYSLGRDLARAQPGDLLFFRQSRDEPDFHSMIYVGRSLVRDDGRRYVVYHTGPEGSNPGEIRRLSIDELLRFPRAEWRPLDGNPGFLGLSRWNILRKVAE